MLNAPDAPFPSAVELVLRRYGAPADLMLCTGALHDILDDLSAERVRVTIIAGRIAFARG